jgi:DNA-directed RNA polymerase specialized sigma24 family protein
MSYALADIIGTRGWNWEEMNDPRLVDQFTNDPETAYGQLLERFTPIILRMIHRFMRDPDEVMEVYTSICERLRANNYNALRRFRTNSELTPWLSVVVANACRDRFRKTRTTSVPKSVLSKLDEREQLIFRYYFQYHMPHEDIAEVVSSRHRLPCSALEVVRAIEKINDLLSIKKRWLLLTALNTRRPPVSIDELHDDYGYQPISDDSPADVDEALRNRETIKRLNEALATLGGEDQLLVLLRFEHGMTAGQIAEVMHFENHKYVYTRLRTVMGRLRRQMAEEDA